MEDLNKTAKTTAQQNMLASVITFEENSVGQPIAIQSSHEKYQIGDASVVSSDLVSQTETGLNGECLNGAASKMRAKGGGSNVRNTGTSEDKPLETKYSGQKVNHNHLSPLMKFVLLNAADGFERGELVEKFYRLERRYCGYDADLCLRGKQKRDYECRYRRSQPVVSRTLKRLEKRGLVNLIKRRNYIKKICLTQKGIIVAGQLHKTQSRNAEDR